MLTIEGIEQEVLYMPYSRKLLALSLVAVFILGVAASGCISSKTSSSTSSTSSSVTHKTTTTITSTTTSTTTTTSTITTTTTSKIYKMTIYDWWTAGGEKQAIDTLIKAFEKKYPNIKVIQNPVSGGAGVNMKMVLQVLMLAGKPPDTFQIHAGYAMEPYIKANQLAPIDDIWTASMKKNYPKILQQMVIFNGHYYAVPLDVHRANVIWYNKKIFEKYGINASKIKTFTDLLEVAKKLKKDGVTPFALGDRNKWPATMIFELALASQGISFYQKFINGEITQSDLPTLKKVLQEVVEYVNYSNSNHADLTWDEACGLVYSGKAAMTLMGDWADGYFKVKGWKPNVDYGAIIIPAGVYDLVIDAFVLPAKASDPYATKKWLSFLGTVQAQNIFNPIKGSVAPRMDAPITPYDPIQKEFIKQLRTPGYILIPSIAHGSAVPPAFLTDLNNIISELVTSKNVNKVAQEILSAMKKDLIPNKIKEWKLT